MKKIHSRTRGGYTLLFAVIVASIVLSVAAFILSVSRKQFILASAARDSTFAIYAADSGIQCAVRAYSQSMATTTVTNMDCNNVSTPISFASYSGNETAGMGFSPSGTVYKAELWPIAMFGPADGCFIIRIYDGFTDEGSHKTVIESRGYNIGDAVTCPYVHPRAEERAIRLIYYD